jgi:peptide/nickel transport system substrate-binding protein
MSHKHLLNKTMTTVFALVLASMLFFSASIRAASDSTVTYAMYGDIADWDPASAASLEVLMLVNVYEPLLWYNAPGSAEQFSPALATSWSVSDDGLSWTFNLRKKVKFHDGEAFNAAAAKASLDRTMKLGKGLAYIWGNLHSMRPICTLPKQQNQGLTGLMPETPLELALIQSVNGIKRNRLY